MTLPLAVLDFVGIEFGESPVASVAGAVQVAQAVERAGYRRYWVSEHHNMSSLACSAPEILVAHLASQTSTLRIGSAGIMLPNHSAYKVAETFRTLLALAPGRIDLGLGRAPGTDPLAAHVLRRGVQADAAAEFPGQVGELLGFLGIPGQEFPADHPYARLTTAPVVDDVPELFILGSSGYGTRFAAVNGMRTVFAHHMSPDLAVQALQQYRAEFTPGVEDAPWSAVSVLAFASDDDDDVARFEAAWRLTLANLGRGVREPLRPEEIEALAASPEFRNAPRDDGRMVTGSPRKVVERLQKLQAETGADEVVVVTPSLDRARRIASFERIAQAWA